MLQDIIRQLQMREDDSSAIPESQVRRWMLSNDPEVLGATYSLLMNAKLTERIIPSLSLDEVFAFILRYYELCLKNNPQGEWVDDRFTAGCEFVRVFVSFWDERRDEKYFGEMKSLLSRLYLEGPAELKDSIEQAIVEHLFERSDIQQFFSDWRDNPQLRPAYDAGKLWAEGGGTSPLTERDR